MKYVFDKNGIVNSENTERLVQYSINANILQVAFTDLNIKEYVPYVAFERADGKVSPLIGMAFTDFELSGTKYIGASYSFSDSWITAQSGILKVAIILKKNNVNARTSTFNLNIAESISEDKVNYIDDVAYNELVGRVYQLEKKQQDIINGDLSVGVADKAHSDYFGHEFTEHYETKIGATEKVNALKQKVENGEVIGYGSHRDGVGNNIVQTYERKEDATKKLNEAKQYANSIKPTKLSDLTQDINYALKNELPTKLSELNNDSGFITRLIDNLLNYYNKAEIKALIAGVSTLDIRIVSILPTENISNTTIYLLATTDTEENNVYEEYIYANNRWELLGNTKVDLSDYAKLSQVPTKTSQLTNDSGFVTKESFSQQVIKKGEVLHYGTWKIVNPYFIDFKTTHNTNFAFSDSDGNSFTGIMINKQSASGKEYLVLKGLKTVDGVTEETTILHTGNQYNTVFIGIAANDGVLRDDYYLTFAQYDEKIINIIKKLCVPFEYKTDTSDIIFATPEYVNKVNYEFSKEIDEKKADKTAIPTKTSQLNNDSGFIISSQSKNYTSMNFIAKDFEVNNNPTTLTGGKWIFKDDYTYFNWGSMSTNIIDTNGNHFLFIELYQNVFKGLIGDSEWITIFDPVNKTGLAYKDGVINEDYAIEFLKESYSERFLPIFKISATKYEYVDIYEKLGDISSVLDQLNGVV